MRYLALPLTADAREAHPQGVQGRYACVANMIRYGLRHAHPGEYAIRVKGTARPVAIAYVRATGSPPISEPNRWGRHLVAPSAATPPLAGRTAARSLAALGQPEDHAAFASVDS
jgi:hypothetical protein